MKSLVGILLSFGAALGFALPTDSRKGLEKDFEELIALVPKHELIKLQEYYMKNDAEVRDILLYFRTREFQDAISVLSLQPEYQEFIRWTAEHYEFNHFAEDNISHEMNVEGVELFYNESGWKGFIKEYLRIANMEKMTELIKMKVSEGGIFAEYWHRFQSLKDVYNRLIADPKVVAVIEQSEKLGVDVKDVDLYIRNLLEWN